MTRNYCPPRALAKRTTRSWGRSTVRVCCVSPSAQRTYALALRHRAPSLCATAASAALPYPHPPTHPTAGVFLSRIAQLALRLVPSERSSLWGRFGYTTSDDGSARALSAAEQDAVVTYELRECAALMRPVLAHLQVFMAREGIR